MNKGIVTVIVLLVAATTASADGIALWGLTADGADHLLEMRLGLERGPIELGVAVKGFSAQPEWGPEVEALGPYMLWQVATVGDADAMSSSALGNLFSGNLLARPYAGVEALLAPEQASWRDAMALNKWDVNWIAGLMVSADPDFRWSVCVEYIRGQGLLAADVVADEEDVVTFGMRILF